MKEYRVLTASTPAQAEEVMNQMARQGWSVTAVTNWDTTLDYRLAITFEKNV